MKTHQKVEKASNRPKFMFWFKDFTLIDCNKANSDNDDDTEDKMERDEGYCNPLGP